MAKYRNKSNAKVQDARTFREETGVSVDHVLAKEPAIAEFIVPLDQLDPVAFGETQFIRTPGLEVVCNII
jgi:hypothetical protein